MSNHWWLAVRYAAWVSAGAALVGAVVWSLYGGAHAGAFLFGAGAGLVSFVSTALTVSLLTGRSTVVGIMVGGASFGARCGFAAAVLGIPAYLELWPVLPMLGGFAGVYLAENAILLPGVSKAVVGNSGTGRERVERRVEA
jgi:hypothetical protein